MQREFTSIEINMDPGVGIYIYVYYSSFDEGIQRKQKNDKRRAITVKVTLTSARCDAVFHIRR